MCRHAAAPLSAIAAECSPHTPRMQKRYHQNGVHPMASTTLAAQTGFAAKSHQLLLGKEAALAAVCTTIIIRLSCSVGLLAPLLIDP